MRLPRRGCEEPTAVASQKRTLVEFLTTAVSAHLSTSALGAHPDEFAIELAVDFDPSRPSAELGRMYDNGSLR